MPIEEKKYQNVKPTRSAQNVIELDSVRFVTQKIVFIFLETNHEIF